MKYVPLHLHTEYSLLDGAIRIKDLCKFVKEQGMTSVAITDHGVMYGDLELYTTAKAEGVHPILGSEFYVHSGDITEKNSANNPCYHLILLAKNKTGYQNLIKLTSVAWCEGRYYKPRINFELIQKYHEGLICLSACLGGEVLRAMREQGYDAAKEVAKRYQKVFGEDYYLELQDHGLREQKETNPQLLKLADELGIEPVITNDSHYLRKEDADMHDTLLCMQTNSDKDDPNRFHFESNEFYVKTEDEMRDAFRWMSAETFERCVDNTSKIAEKCHLVIELKNSPLPAFEVPKGYTTETYLSKLVFDGLKKRYKDVTDDLKQRADYELGVINQMGFAAYFLITGDFIHFAKTHGIPVGPGRGSAAGSIVAYALEITDLDPIKHKLLFERFLNPERFTMPDIDIDFCIERRGEVIDYVTKKYGEDRVCQIITFGTYAAKAAFKAIARSLKIPFAESNRMTGLVGDCIDYATTVVEDLNKKNGTNLKANTLGAAIKYEGSELKTLYDQDIEFTTESGKTIGLKRWVDLAIAIEGLKNSTGTHAAGVIIAPKPLDQILPVQPSKDGIIQTGYPPHDVTEELSLLKMDFLGLRNITTIYKALDLIEKRTGKKLEINNIPLDDKDVYNMLSSGDTDGVFQLESAGMKNLVKRLKPDNFEDIGALVALFRPGPLDSGMVDKFVDRKHGKVEVTYPHPLLEPVLKDTYGTIVYQEQIMQVFQILADYSLGQADQVRRMMGKKKVDEMKKQKGIFIERAAKHGMSEKDATELFENIEAFASYCFNRAHSAAYAFVAYQTAYLKCHYPVEYMACLLSSVSNDQEKTQLYIEESLAKGIKILPPDINKSNKEFTPDEGNIRFGLASVKQVGEIVVEQIIKEREENGEFQSIYDFCKRVDPKCTNKRVLEGLIKSGSFASIEKSRKQLLENIEGLVAQANKEAKEKALGQCSLFAGTQEAPVFELVGSDEEFSEKEIQVFEKEFLGFYVTSHPLSSIRTKLPFLTTHKISQLHDLPVNKPVTVCGLITSVRNIPTKNDPSKFHRFLVIEDLTGKIEVACFSKQLDKYVDILQLEQKVIVSGKISKRDENSTSIILDSAKSIDNANIFNISLKEEVPFEELVYMKDILQKYTGSDPVVIKVSTEENVDKKIITSSNFWVQSSNNLVSDLRKFFGERIDIDIKSMN